MQIPFYSRIMSLSAIQRQSTLSLFFTILITVIGFFSTMLFTHILGKDLMGVYYLFLAYYGVFNMIGDGGFGSAAVKRISEGKEQNEYLTAYACLRGLLIVVSTLILLTLSHHQNHYDGDTDVPKSNRKLESKYFDCSRIFGEEMQYDESRRRDDCGQHRKYDVVFHTRAFYADTVEFRRVGRVLNQHQRKYQQQGSRLSCFYTLCVNIPACR